MDDARAGLCKSAAIPASSLLWRWLTAERGAVGNPLQATFSNSQYWGCRQGVKPCAYVSSHTPGAIQALVMPQLWTCSLQAGEHLCFQPLPPPQKSPALAFTQANFADGNATRPTFISHSLSPLFWAPAVRRLSRTSPGDFWQGEDVLWSDSSCRGLALGWVQTAAEEPPPHRTVALV